jgi:putative nucleotidyltransferase with HDIG domain
MSSGESDSIKRIPSTELRVGMYVHKLGASWWKHPFVRGSFLLTDQADITTIIECGIKEVWIDPTKEVAPTPQPAAKSPGPPARRVRPQSPATGDQKPAPADGSAQSGSQKPAPGTASDEPPAEPDPPEKKAGGTVPMEVEVAQAKRICHAAKSQIIDMFHAARLGKAIDPAMTLPLVDEIAASVERHPAALLSVARLKTHDDYTYLHSVAVSALMLSLARQLDLDAKQTRLAGLGGLMHDLGKASMPWEVLNKPGKLTDEEFAIMKHHPTAGAEALRAVGAEPEVLDMALHHHEKMDGTGYPDRLSGDAIPMMARMLAVCDVYDAVTSERVYKKPWDPSAAMHQMAKWGGHFDKEVFNAFVKTVGIYPVGSLVRLASQRLAVVIEPGRESLLTPKVRMFFSLRSNEPIALEIVDLAASWCRDKIAGPEDPQKWGFKSLDHLWME